MAFCCSQLRLEEEMESCYSSMCLLSKLLAIKVFRIGREREKAWNQASLCSKPEQHLHPISMSKPLRRPSQTVYATEPF